MRTPSPTLLLKGTTLKITGGYLQPIFSRYIRRERTCLYSTQHRAELELIGNGRSYIILHPR
jgi:hypothetical protein